jgi:hypothetical protein
VSEASPHRPAGILAVAAKVPAPVAAFSLVYVATCWIGAMSLLLGPSWVRESYVYLSGADMPQLAARDVLVDLVLLNVAACVLLAGWLAATRLLPRAAAADLASRDAPGIPGESAGRVVWTLLGLSLVYLVIRFATTDALRGLDAWGDYDRFLEGRRSVTEALSFPDFVIAYSILPLLVGAAIADVVVKPWPGRRRALTIAGLLALLLLVSLALFQKRSLFVGLLTVAGVVLLHPRARALLAAFASQRRRGFAAAAGTLAAGYGVYLALLVAPVVSDTLSPVGQDPSPIVSLDFGAGTSGWHTAGEFVNAGAVMRMASGRFGPGLSVRAAEPLEGVTYATGVTARGRSAWEFTVAVYAPEPTDVTLLIGDDAVDAAVTTVRAGPSWRSARVQWTPLREVPEVKLALRATERARFIVDDVTLRRLTPAPPSAPDPSLIVDATFDKSHRAWSSAGEFLAAGARKRSVTGFRGKALEVTGARRLQGVSYSTGERAVPGETWTLQVRLRGRPDRPVTLLLGRDRRDPAIMEIEPSRQWKSHRLVWRPTHPVERVQLAVRTVGATAFALDDVTVRRSRPDTSLLVAASFEKGGEGWNKAGEFLNAGSRRRITQGHSGRGLEVIAAAPLEGVSLPTGATADSSHAYVFSARLRARVPTRVELLIGRDLERPGVRTATARPEWQQISLVWVPHRSIPDIATAVRLLGRGSVTIDDVKVRSVALARRATSAGVVLDSRFEQEASSWSPAGEFVIAGAHTSTADGERGAGLAFEASKALQGIAAPTGVKARAGQTWHLSVWLRADDASQATLLLGRDRVDSEVATVPVSPQWRRYTLIWRPDRAVPVHAAIRMDDPGRLVVDEIRLGRILPHRGLVIDADFETSPTGWTTAGEFLLAGSRVDQGEGLHGRALRVATERSLQGISYRTGQSVPARSRWRLTAFLRSRSNTPVQLAVGRDLRSVGIGTFKLDTHWRRYAVPWTANDALTDLRLAARTTRRGSFEIDRVQLRRFPRAPAGSSRGGGGLPLGVGLYFAPRGLGVTFPRPGELDPKRPGVALGLYALLGPVTRTSGPAVAYPAIFPNRRPYYPVDLGLDAVGIGVAPDDNRTSFEEMFPGSPRSGTNSVPFMFTLYSQGGVLIALLGALLTGAAWRVSWKLCGDGRCNSLETAWAGALVTVFGVFIAGDSVRNSLLAYYGLLWPALFVLLVALVRRISRLRS